MAMPSDAGDELIRRDARCCLGCVLIPVAFIVLMFILVFIVVIMAAIFLPMDADGRLQELQDRNDELLEQLDGPHVTDEQVTAILEEISKNRGRMEALREVIREESEAAGEAATEDSPSE